MSVKSSTAKRNKVVKKKVKRVIPQGQVHVHATFNNTIITITDAQGNKIAQESSGSLGFRGAKKSTPYAAQVAAKKVAQRAIECGMRTVDVFIWGPGPGKIDAVRALNDCFLVRMIKDVTGVPHNGCRAPKERRV